MRFLLALVLVLAARAQSPLADQLEATATDQERAAVLAAHPEGRDEALKAVYARGLERFGKAEYDAALRAYRAALAIAAANSDQPEMARAMRRVAVCMQRKGDLTGSLPLLDQALEWSTKAGDKATMAEALLALTAAYAPLGRLDDAEHAARRGIEVNKGLGDQRRALSMMLNLSVILGEKGDQEAKAEILRQVIQDAGTGAFNDILMFAVNNLGVVYFDQGDYERSLQYIERAVELIEKHPMLEKERVSMLHSNLAVMLDRLGRAPEAFAEYDKAAALVGPETGFGAHIRFNRGSLYKTTGNPQKAVEEYRAASKIYEKSDNRTDAIRTNAGLAVGLLETGQPQAAAEVAASTLREARAVGGPDLIWLALSPLGEANLTLGKRDEARAAFLEAIETVERVKLAGGEDEKENFFHEKATPYHGMVKLLVEEGSPFEALRYAERAKARLLVDVLRGGRAEIARAMPEADRQKERELGAAIAKLDAQLARQGARSAAGLLAERNNAALELDKFHAALYKAHPELRVKRAEFPPLEMEQLGDLLRDSDTALLEYTVTSGAVYLFAIARDVRGVPRVETHVLRDPAALASQIERFRAQLAARDFEYRPAAQALYTRALGPAAALLRGKKRLIIVADGALWNLPFQALVSPQGRHVIEDAAVFYAPSLTAAREMLHLARAGNDPARTLLALGGPASTGALPALPEAVREVRQIGAIYGPQASAVMAGDQADKQQWKTKAPGYRILHLATHGVLNSNNPLYSYLVMNRAPGGREDSLLTAREILGMNLAADLTVLSACETARGKFRFGEGLIGLSWAFLVAGTPATVVSQWKVDSAATSELMVAFHRRVKPAAGGPLHGRAEALRGAVLELLGSSEYRHPFYWAGFVMIGNGF